MESVSRGKESTEAKCPSPHDPSVTLTSWRWWFVRFLHQFPSHPFHWALEVTECCHTAWGSAPSPGGHSGCEIIWNPAREICLLPPFIHSFIHSSSLWVWTRGNLFYTWVISHMTLFCSQIVSALASGSSATWHCVPLCHLVFPGFQAHLVYFLPEPSVNFSWLVNSDYLTLPLFIVRGINCRSRICAECQLSILP